MPKCPQNIIVFLLVNKCEVNGVPFQESSLCIALQSGETPFLRFMKLKYKMHCNCTDSTDLLTGCASATAHPMVKGPFTYALISYQLVDTHL